MKLSLTRRLLVVALAVSASLITTAAEKAPKSKTLVDFTREDVERNGADVRQIHRYDFAWNAWEGKLVFLEKRGLLVPALPGDGVFGANSRLSFGPATRAELEVVIGNRNEAESFNFTLVDSDGTQASWSLPLKDQRKGEKLTYHLALESPDRTENSGKKPGLDTARIKKWEIKGNWQPAPLEVLFVRIGTAPPAAPSAPAQQAGKTVP